MIPPSGFILSLVVRADTPPLTNVSADHVLVADLDAPIRVDDDRHHVAQFERLIEHVLVPTDLPLFELDPLLRPVLFQFQAGWTGWEGVNDSDAQ